jgi:Mg2+ and Co2+ transporter CorA
VPSYPLNTDTSKEIEEIHSRIHELRRQMIDITTEISNLIKNKNISLRSEEYQFLKEKYYSVKYKIKNFQHLLSSLEQSVAKAV